MNPVVIAAFRDQQDAESARRALDREGIAGDVAARNDALPRLCVDAFDAGFDLIVDASHADSAIAFLQRLWPDEPPVAVERCPECGSTDVLRIRRLRFFIVSTIVLLVIAALSEMFESFSMFIMVLAVMLLITPSRRCRECGERWRGKYVPEAMVEPPDVLCPRCGSEETETITRRREKAATLLVNLILPPLLLVFPFLAQRRCTQCGHEWR